MLEPPPGRRRVSTSPMKHAGDRASLGFAAGVGAVVAVFCAACLLVAQREWFVFDDFFFLRYVQEARPWVWLDPRVAMVERVWPFYRPLGMQTFYYVGLQLFGLNAVGFTALALLVDLLTGLLVLRIARWLGFGWPAAAASAVLAATRGPATYVLFEAFSFQYTSAVFFYALGVVCFLEHLRKGGLRYQVAGCVALGLGLFCNEVVLTLPGVLTLAALITEDRSARTPGGPSSGSLPSSWSSRATWCSALPCWPPWRCPPSTTTRSARTSRNLGRLFAYAFGGGPALGLAAVLATGIVWSAYRSETTPPRSLGRLLEVHLLCVGWMAIVLLPFVALPAVKVRYATALGAPVSLLLGSYLDLLGRVYGQRRGRLIEAALLGLLVVSLPCTMLMDRARNPAGAEPKRLAEIMSQYTRGQHETTRFILFHGAPGLAKPRQVEIFRRRLYGGKFIQALYPDRRATMRLVDVSKHLANFGKYGRCVYLTLDRKSRVALAEPAVLERIMPERLVGRCISRGES